MRRGAIGTARAVTSGPDTARFSWLLAALATVFVLPPFLEALSVSVANQRLALAVVLVGSLVAVSRRRRTLWIGIGLAGATLALDAGSVAGDSRTLAIAGGVSATLFLGLVAASMVRALLSAERVTTDTILGGICVFLLLGLLFHSAFTLLENVEPGSLQVGGVPLSDQIPAPQEAFRYEEMLYFSFVTLTTLGYGDVTPATSTARTLAAAEAVVGQLYVAIFVARLVGLHLAEGRARSPE